MHHQAQQQVSFFFLPPFATTWKRGLSMLGGMGERMIWISLGAFSAPRGTGNGKTQ